MLALKLCSSLSVRSLLRAERHLFTAGGRASSCAFSTKSMEFESVYSLPYIKYIAPLCASPKYAIIISALTVPIAGAIEYTMDVLPENFTLVTCSSGLTFIMLTALVGIVFRNTIGFIYVSKDNKKIKVAHVDRWGNRVDTIMPLNYWVPLSELPVRKMDKLFFTVRTSNDLKYKLFYHQGILDNPELANFVIGTP